VTDAEVRAVVDPAGEIYLMWIREGDLVLDRNLTGSPSLVRPESATIGFAAHRLTLNPDGNLVLLWQEQTPDGGVDPYYSVYDPASGRWSTDTRLATDDDVEGSFSPVWDSAGNLTVVYDRTTVSPGSEEFTTDEGETITIDNVAQFGETELFVMKRGLVNDVGFESGDLEARSWRFLPGDTVQLNATVRNLGDFPAEDLELALYDGDPAVDGEEIVPRRIVEGYLDGSDTAKFEVVWEIPEPARPRTIFAVIDPDDRVSESDETNNTLSLEIGGTDLKPYLRKREVAEDGSAWMTVRVVNEGGPAAPSSILAVRDRSNPEGPPLDTSLVPGLEPGARAEASLTLPAGSIEGEALFLVRADDTNVVDDVNRDNNVVEFALGAGAPPLVGDCNGDASVTVDEILTGINIALGLRPLEDCPGFDENLDGQVTVDELITAIVNALNT
jgi:hypothetical protein